MEKNFQTAREIWLVFPHKSSGRQRIPYNDAVEEALCFGWIDSIVKKHDDESSMQRFTPRNPRKRLLPAKRERLRLLLAEGRVHPSVRETAERLVAEEFVFPDDIMDAIKSDPTAWKISSPSPGRINGYAWHISTGHARARRHSGRGWKLHQENPGEQDDLVTGHREILCGGLSGRSDAPIRRVYPVIHPRRAFTGQAPSSFFHHIQKKRVRFPPVFRYTIPVPSRKRPGAIYKYLESAPMPLHEEKVELLRRVDLFSALREYELDIIARSSEMVRFDRGVAVFSRGAEARELYVVRSGRVGIIAVESEDSVAIAQIAPGESFGSWSFSRTRRARRRPSLRRNRCCYAFPRWASPWPISCATIPTSPRARSTACLASSPGASGASGGS